MSKAKTARELKPCPFCGGEGELQESGVPQFWHVVCLGCFVHGPMVYKKLAIQAWNKRPALDAEQEENKEALGILSPWLADARRGKHVCSDISTLTRVEQALKKGGA